MTEIECYTPQEERLIRERIRTHWTDGWPDCRVEGCRAKCHVPSMKCYPHTSDEAIRVLGLMPRCSTEGCLYSEGHDVQPCGDPYAE